MNGPSDAKYRKAIVTDIDASILVEAGAGSGKTTSLINRMLALIASGRCQVQTMTAVTFTRKAAAELKGRFQIALETAAREEKPGKVRDRYLEALLNLDLLFADTIHSFCARLLRERPVEAGIDPDFIELEEDENALLRSRCWADYIENLHVWGSDLLAALSDLGIDPSRLTGTYNALCMYPEVEVVRKEMERPDFSRERKLLDEYLRDAWAALPRTVPPDDWDNLQSLLKRLQRLCRNLDLSDDRNLMLVLDALNRSSGVVQKRWDDAETAKRQQAAHEAFRDQVAVPAIEKWHRYCHFFIMEMIIPAVHHFDKVRQENSQVNYQDLLMKAAWLLKNNPEVRRYFQKRFTHILVDEFQDTDPIQAEVILYLAAANPDETSWRNVKVRPGALFVVGDPKQSIYRFRRADIDTYNEVKGIIGQSGGKIVPLTVNFRSVPALCNWVNPVFCGKFPEKADRFQPAFERLEPYSSSKEGGIRCITIERQPYHNQAEVAARDAERIASWIAWALKGNYEVIDDGKAARSARPEDFMILLRYKRHISLYARSLEARGIPYDVAGGAGFGQSEEVGEMLTLLASVAEPDDQVALVGTLRGPFFGVSDDLLYRYRSTGGRFTYLHEEIGATDEEAGAKIGEALATLRQFYRWSKTHPPAAALNAILNGLGIIPYSTAREMGKTRAGNLLKMVELAEAACRKGCWSFPEVVGVIRQYYEELETEELSVEPGRRQVVRIMNLHKAKGLEAAVVFLADPLKDSDFPPDVHINRIGDKATGYFLSAVPANNWGGMKVIGVPPGWEEKEVLEEKYSRAEEERLLYVATTRAKQLLVVSRYPSNADKGAWKDLDPFLKDVKELEEASIAISEKKQGIVSKEEFQEARNRIATQVAKSKAASFTVDTVTGIAEERPTETPFSGDGMGMKWGGMIHKALQVLLEYESVQLDILAEALLRENEIPASEKNALIEILNPVLSSAFWKRVKKAEKRFCEIPFAAKMDGPLPGTLSGIIDLAFLEPDGWVIADYKSDRVNDNIEKLAAYYSHQVNIYRKFWEEITGQKVKEAGIYFTSIDKWVAA